MSLVYGYKRGSFYPFAPRGQTPRQHLELRVQSMLAHELPLEPELERWYPSGTRRPAEPVLRGDQPLGRQQLARLGQRGAVTRHDRVGRVEVGGGQRRSRAR